MSIRRLVPLNTVSLPSNPSTAIAGDIYYNSGLSKLLYFNGTDWIELAGSVNSLVYAKSIYQDVRNESGSTIPLGTPVYISGAIGASGKILISPASNASEATSSKTMGITTSSISNNNNGQIISEGLLEGVDTTGAADGDPVWLGVGGAKIYGLANKPTAPAHLVFLGIVVRGGSANTGSIFVKIQNGFELEELHNVQISSLINGNILAYDSTTSTWKNTNTLQSTASTVPLVIKNSASQTANLQEWQNSSGTVLSNINNVGAANFVRAGIGGATPGTTPLFVTSPNASYIATIIRAASGQTANITEWQDSSGTTLNRINSAGHTIASSRSVFGGTTSIVSGMIIAAVSQEVAAIPILARGAASQTADLQQWQNSAGTALVNISSSGVLNTNANINLIGVSAGGLNRTIDYGNSYGAAALYLYNAGAGARWGWGLNAGEMQFFATNDSATNHFSWNRGGDLQAVGTNEIMRLTVGNGATSTLNLNTGGTAATGLVIKGVASQTANLQEWQNSTGTTVASMNIAGDLTNSAVFARYLRSGNETFIDLAALRIKANSPIIPSSVFKGIANQSSHLHQYQNSSGSVLSGFNAAGHIFVGATEPANGVDVYYTWTAAATTSATVATFTSSSTVILASSGQNITSSGFSPAQFNGTFTVTSVTGSSGAYVYTVYNPAANFTFPDSATSTAGTIRIGAGATFVAPTLYSVPVLVKGVGSQSTNLTEWQNSSGSIVARVGNGGQIVSSGVGVFGAQSNASNAQLAVIANSLVYPTFVTKAIASQTANLTEWQDSSGGALSFVGPTGVLTLNNGNSTPPATYALIVKRTSFFDTGDAASAGIIVRARASQTANLQEWQNSSSAVLTKVDANGKILVYGDDLGNFQSIGSTTTLYNGFTATNNNNLGSYTLGTAGSAETTFNVPNAFYIYDRINGSMRFKIMSTGLVGINSYTPGAQLQVNSSSASTIALIAKGTTSQSANIQEWQDVSGGTLSSISPLGVISGKGLSISTSTNTTNGATIYNSTGTPVFNVNTSLTEVNLGGGLSGSANNYGSSWGYDSSVNAGFITFQTGALGTDSLAMRRTNHVASGDYTISTLGNMRLSTASGKNFNFNNGNIGVATTAIGTNNKIIVNPYSAVDNLATVQINTSDAANKGLVVQGILLQSGNLQEWQNASGTVLASISPSGSFTVPSLTISGDLTVNGTTTNINTTNLVVEDKNITIADVTTPTDTTADGAGITIKGATDKTLNWVQSTGSFTSSEPFIINTNSTTKQNLIIKAIASQTANLQEWQDSTGTVLSSISSAGSLNLGAGKLISFSNGTVQKISLGYGGNYAIGVDDYTTVITADNNASNGRVGIRPHTATYGTGYISPIELYANGQIKQNLTVTSVVGHIIKAVASQTANLTEWQNSSGTVLTSVDKDGYLQTPRLVITNGGNIIDSAGTTPYFGFGSNQIIIYARNAAYKPLVIQGAASQTADLQQWQDSTGTVLAEVMSNGSLFINSTGTSNDPITIQRASATRFKVDPYGNVFAGALTAGSVVTSIAGTTAGIYPSSASTNGLIIRGAASQTADLQQWQNSAGTTLLSVSPDGYLNKTGTVYIGPNLTFADPGVGNETKFVFTKSTDGAYLTVKERSADQTFYEFGMYDNALDGGDYFQWANGQWSGPGYGWMPLQLGNNSGKTQTLRFVGEQSIFWSPISTPVNSPYFTYLPVNIASTDYEVNKWAPDNGSGTNIRRLESSGSTATFNIDISGYTYAARMGYRITIDAGATTFSYTTYGGDNSSGSAIAINAGNWVTLSNGLKIKIGAGALAGENWSFLAFPTPRVGIGGATDTSALGIIRPAATDKGLIIKGAVSQTANLQEWQDSAGTSLSSVDSTGRFVSTIGLYTNAKISIGGASWSGGAANLNVWTTGTTTVGTIIRGTASQTANLQEWQNSAGTILSSIASNGATTIDVASAASTSTQLFLSNSGTGVNTAAKIQFRLGGAAHGSISSVYLATPSVGSALLFSTNDSVGTEIERARIDNSGTFNISGFGSAAKGLVVKAAASQSANIQEWQNSTGTVLAYVRPGGGIYSTATDDNRLYNLGIGGSSIGISWLYVTPSLATEKPVVIRGIASQSANLTEWQNSSATVLAKVDANGNFSAISKSFDIPHPTKENMRLRYASLEGNEHGVYVRGTTKEKFIELPEYWTELVDESTITVSLTSIGKFQKVYVEKIEGNKIYIGGRVKEISYAVFGERKDIDKLIVEY